MSWVGKAGCVDVKDIWIREEIKGEQSNLFKCRTKKGGDHDSIEITGELVQVTPVDLGCGRIKAKNTCYDANWNCSVWESLQLVVSWLFAMSNNNSLSL